MPENSLSAIAAQPNPKLPRTPPAFNGLQVNFCKNPSCELFGVRVPETAKKGHGAKNSHIVVAFAKGDPAIRCNSCGEHFPLKSNLGIFEEFHRISKTTFTVPCCPDCMCSNHLVPITQPKAYHSFGLTTAGSHCYRCKVCSKTFSVKPKGINPIARQLRSDKNPPVLRMLTGKMPLRRICEAADVAPKVLYERIDFFHEQSMALMAEREAKLASMNIRRLYIGVDRQEYVVNWTQRKDRRNVVITAVASADNGTGYVFGMHPNFDPIPDPTVIQREVERIGDAALPSGYRRYARLWLQSDYEEAMHGSVRIAAGSLTGKIANSYAQAAGREDVESAEFFEQHEKLPNAGMLIHSEYTLYGHFMHLNRLLGGVEKLRFFLDQDSGIRAACLGAFHERVKNRTADALYVSMAKELTIDQKRQRMSEARAAFTKESALHPGLSEAQVKLILLKRRIQEATALGQWRDRWVFHPLVSMSEPEKASCLLTDLGDYDEDHLAWLHNKASLHAVDSWFNRLRRRSSMLERPITGASNRGRTWNGYSAYRPEQIEKLQTIFRACHNYVWTGEKRTDTPAMRLGLAKAPLDYTDIIYFK
ncbi:hypothetical protein [Polaromonas sp. JS666]|uniref:hypothetical protein n=1 Tax=Polaromonas sp. (strain JS666 / ATCC BAA-500) TaxID=296591 RepID=UPI0000532C91|nr:hypothetical protein [Polaromonas sp. JS666]ABE47202.1 hypothetical protein Bpro_5346 [Polaromonas sp. JS666]